MIVNISVLFLSTFGGAWLARLFVSGKEYALKVLLAFSGSFLLAITALHILPDIFLESGHNHSIGIFILMGILLQIVLEFFTQGIEHGHLHHHNGLAHHQMLSPAAVGGLYLHSFLESLPLGVQWLNESGGILFWGIVLHHLPVGIILYTMFKAIGMKRQKILLFLGLFALSSPAGALTGFFVPIFRDIYLYLLAIVAGIFMHISTTIIFETNHNHRFNLMKVISFILAVILAYQLVENFR
ncbi:zinc/iron permease [Schleiferia thermophila str. Yellowstone]|uniref:ZIP family metal transporter n=1 Tax=Schleiferia thermophila TaxID=884107 RepID=UPI0004E74673|nr:ZIP family metal transporter [Schleiferia thermophila]KFD40170.1 zinc/iron permease [Schleiferia thermophila str. Yellowstone]